MWGIRAQPIEPMHALLKAALEPMSQGKIEQRHDEPRLARYHARFDDLLQQGYGTVKITFVKVDVAEI